MVICLKRGADWHTAQQMPLPLTVSCFSKIQVGFTFLVPAHPGSPGQRAVKRVCYDTKPSHQHACQLMTFKHQQIVVRFLEQTTTQMLAKPSLNLLQRTGGDHWGGRAQLG